MRLVLSQCPCDFFFSYFALVEEMIPAMIKKTMELHMLPNLASAIIMKQVLIFKCPKVEWTPLPW
jgi:hypothetical protein